MECRFQIPKEIPAKAVTVMEVEGKVESEELVNRIRPNYEDKTVRTALFGKKK